MRLFKTSLKRCQRYTRSHSFVREDFNLYAEEDNGDTIAISIPRGTEIYNPGTPVMYPSSKTKTLVVFFFAERKQKLGPCQVVVKKNGEVLTKNCQHHLEVIKRTNHPMATAIG